ncbi:zinc-finger domain-containing protein [Alphaproteobacteria bacterium]|nr:zinc-finger domain-containing protein [Alphaproteobacteria bacterium]|tara:strand:+ start:643 stop:801 length:159 start_codon:yes stop_codon:yes gene_type:complete
MQENQLFEKIEIEGNKTSCDGGEIGHPLVYLSIPKNSDIACPYCGRIFTQKK